MKTISDCGGIFLPVGQMLLIDRIAGMNDTSIVCESDLAGHWVFDVHFPGDPIFPGSLIIEGAGQAVATWMWEQGMRGMPRLVRTGAEFKSPVTPEDSVIVYHAVIRRRRNVCVASVEAHANGRLVAIVTATLMVLEPFTSGSMPRVQALQESD